MASNTDFRDSQITSHVEVAVEPTSQDNDVIMADACDGALDTLDIARLQRNLTLPPITEASSNGDKNNTDFKSRPPSPPTRPDSPYDYYPLRLQPYIPPPNFGAVTDHKVFRSAFPQDRNVDFLEALGVKSLLCFVETNPSEGYSSFVQQNAVTRHRIDITPNKDGKVGTSVDSICEALLIVLDAANYPLLIHCNQGRHRTGCVIACMRKVQGWPIEATLAEYEAYANPKARAGDIEFITNVFQPEALLDHAKRHGGHFERRPSLASLLHSGLLDVDKLVRVLGSTDGVLAPSNASLKSDVSKPDSGVDLSGPGNGTVNPLLLADGGGAQQGDSRVSEVSVMECGPMSPPVNENEAPGYLF